VKIKQKIHEFLHNNDWSLVLMIPLRSEQPKINKLNFFFLQSKSDLWVFQGTEDFLEKKSTKNNIFGECYVQNDNSHKVMTKCHFHNNGYLNFL